MERHLDPWPILRTHARAIGVGIATCLVLLATVELALFRSGLFASNVAVSDPQWPAAKLAIAARQPDTRVLYVGDSTIMTSVLPSIVSAICECGPGFNGGFSAADPWLTDAMTRRLLEFMRPDIVVISTSPWTVDSVARFADSDSARQLMSVAELEARGVRLDLEQRLDAGIASLWSAYGQRQLLKEWASALAPGQRYDETLLGYYVAPGSATSYARLAAQADRLFEDVDGASPEAPGAVVMRALVDELHARGITVAFLLPPLHPAAFEHAGPYLERADVALRELAGQRGVPIIDCRATVSGGDFRDVTHLLASGAAKHSGCVGEQLRAVLAD
ncbi:MAG TPA: hypothetical protein VJP45_14250 [Candidatus Limnocylindria bacterium]|nr:hypothetical protein [Candidatus Limnocylindria bacterium]